MTISTSHRRDLTTPPHSIDAEQAVLGSLLVPPSMAALVSGSLDASHFYAVKHGWIYDAILKCGDAVDILTVCSELDRQQMGRAAECGGVPYIAELMNYVPSSLNIQHYANIVVEMAARRQMLLACSEIARMSYDYSTDIDVMTEKATSLVHSTKQVSPSVKEFRLADDMDGMLEYINDDTDMPLLSTGLDSVDRLIGGGFLQNEYGIIAAGPGGGKTGLAVQIVYYNARQGKSGLYFSFEVSRREIQARLISLHVWTLKKLRIPFSAILKRTLSAEHREVCEMAWKHLCQHYKITIVDDASLTPAQVQASAIRVLHKTGLDLIVCDQLQHMKDGSGMARAGNERQIVSSISGQLRELPKELGKHKGCDGVPVIALSRLSRDGYDEPTMAHLKESGDIESDAHWITLLWQQDKSQQSGDPAQSKVWLKVEKCRNGASGVKVALDYDKSTNHLR